MTWLNGICQGLKLTYTHSPEGVELLDHFVYVADNFIHTKLFSKKSDTHCYLIPSSCHKDHVVKNIPFRVARRVRQNNSEGTIFEEQNVLYSSHLSRRGYNSEIINIAFNKLSDITKRKDLYRVKPDAKNKGKGVTPLVMDNNHAMPHVNSMIHRHKHLLEKDESLKTIIPPGSVLLSCRKNKTIGGMLIHNRFRPSSSSTQSQDNENPLQPNAIAEEPLSQEIVPGCFACGKCYVCKMDISHLVKVLPATTTQVFSINVLQSTGLIYLISRNVLHVKVLV